MGGWGGVHEAGTLSPVHLPPSSHCRVEGTGRAGNVSPQPRPRWFEMSSSNQDPSYLLSDRSGMGSALCVVLAEPGLPPPLQAELHGPPCPGSQTCWESRVQGGRPLVAIRGCSGDPGWSPSSAPGEEGEHPSDPTPASGFLGRYCPITFISSQDTKQSPSSSSRPTPGHKAGAAAICLLFRGRCTRPEDRLAVSVHACGDEEPQVGAGSSGTSRGQGVWRWGWGDPGREHAAGGGGTGGGVPLLPTPRPPP